MRIKEDDDLSLSLPPSLSGKAVPGPWASAPKLHCTDTSFAWRRLLFRSLVWLIFWFIASIDKVGGNFSCCYQGKGKEIYDWISLESHNLCFKESELFHLHWLCQRGLAKLWSLCCLWPDRTCLGLMRSNTERTLWSDLSLDSYSLLLMTRRIKSAI